MTKYARINFYRNRTTLAYLKNTKGATRKRPVFRTLAGRLQRTRSYVEIEIVPNQAGGSAEQKILYDRPKRFH